MWPLLFCQKYSIILYKTFVTQCIIFHWTNWENMWATKLSECRHVNTSFTSNKHKINLHKWRYRFSRFKKKLWYPKIWKWFGLPTTGYISSADLLKHILLCFYLLCIRHQLQGQEESEHGIQVSASFTKSCFSRLFLYL